MESAFQVLSLSRYFINDLSLEILTYLYGDKAFREEKALNTFIYEPLIDWNDDSEYESMYKLPNQYIRKLYSYPEPVEPENDLRIEAFIRTKSNSEEFLDEIIPSIVGYERYSLNALRAVKNVTEVNNDSLLLHYPKTSAFITEQILEDPTIFTMFGYIRDNATIEDYLGYWKAILAPNDYQKLEQNKDLFMKD